MNKPVIGVTSLINYEANEYRMQYTYMNYIERAGGVPVILPLSDDRDVIRSAFTYLDGIMFSGGPDIAPSFYGQTLSPYCGNISEERDNNELILFKEAIKSDLPIFGICRGLQIMNVALGGTLYQDIPTELDFCLDHEMSEKCEDKQHFVNVEKGTPLYGIFKKERIEVNSYHHQAIKNLAPGLCVSAYSEDGVAEAAYLPGERFIHGVQWHPEKTFESDPCSFKLACEFVLRAKCFRDGKTLK